MFGCNCKKEKEEEKVIGEFLAAHTNQYGNHGIFPAHSVPVGTYFQWYDFRICDRDIYKDHDGYICIRNKFFKQEDVLFHKVVAFDSFKKSIEKKYTAPTSKKG